MVLLADELDQLISKGSRYGRGCHKLDDVISQTYSLDGYVLVGRRFLPCALHPARQCD